MTIQWLLVIIFALNLALIWGIKAYSRAGLVILSCLPFLTVFFPQPRFDLDYFWWYPAGAGLLGLGLILAYLTYAEYKKNHQLLLDWPKKGFLTTGPYAFVRHPYYLALILAWFGWWLVWAAVYSLYFGMFILVLLWLNGWLEDKYVQEKRFGQAYKDYAGQTGMFWVK
ncbi:hypothetical protein A2311_01165 [candidate division WOR-1 bacterium RIFOXYB2_FULL_48_7]|uniref:Uncharacterized protein n=1 Tax=candidate division WOR-1 bacterium RIFOXYB2_FULL_48_7 TaxID=1802583 RepID=A0A1F4TNJ0_UNCSA|nr:MAG: hypothetical protein A2311_01165 [candidate division WOR-1 bacterium RIFOXYB2_FULL_48_7]